MSAGQGGTRLWCLHHIGPDDVHPAPDFSTAQKWADWANNAFAEIADTSRFVVAIWPWSADLHASGLESSIVEWTLPPGSECSTDLDVENVEVAAWTEQERAVIAELCQKQELSEHALHRQALRLYQLHCARLASGEITGWSGDAARSAEFAGPLATSKLLHEQIKHMQPPTDPHTDAWLLGFCRARKMASEMAFLAELATLIPPLNAHPNAARMEKGK